MAKTNAQDLGKRAKGGEDLDKAAKSMGLDAKSSELLARIATVPDVGPMAQLPAAFDVVERPDRRSCFSRRQLGLSTGWWTISNRIQPISPWEDEGRYRAANCSMASSENGLRSLPNVTRCPHEAKRRAKDQR